MHLYRALCQWEMQKAGVSGGIMISDLPICPCPIQLAPLPASYLPFYFWNRDICTTEKAAGSEQPGSPGKYPVIDLGRDARTSA